MNKHKLTVGQKLYRVRTNRWAYPNQEVTVSKIGRKYFEVEEMYRDRFHLDTLTHDSKYTSSYQCYLSMGEYLNEQERKRLFKETKDKLASKGKISLAKLEAINKILNDE